MRILSITSLLPLPGILAGNDFVFQIYKYYQKTYPNDTVRIIKPVKFELNIWKRIKKSSVSQKIGNERIKLIKGFEVNFFLFLSSWSIRNLHALITYTIYYFNKKRIQRLISEGVDIIHAQYIFPDGLLAYLLNKKFGIPYFITSHNERFYFNSRVSRKIGLRIMSNAVEVLPLNYTNSQFYKSIGVSNIEVLPLGFDSKFIRIQKSIEKGPAKILTVCRLLELKNIDKVLHAIQSIYEDLDISYTVIGTGPEKDNLIKLTQRLNLDHLVKFIDEIPYEDIADEMYKYDIFIMPSYFETFGRVYFEAMAMGIPIICAKYSGIYGLFKEYEEGISVKHDDISEIGSALRFLVENPKERLKIGKNGQSFVNNYTWTKIIEILGQKYKSSLGKA